jgi:hypothetical protein
MRGEKSAQPLRGQESLQSLRCGPCGAAAAPAELTTAEANAVYDCLKGEMKSAYAKSGNKYAKIFLNWKNYAKQPYISGGHGQRYVLNYANEKASNYGKY